MAEFGMSPIQVTGDWDTDAERHSAARERQLARVRSEDRRVAEHIRPDHQSVYVRPRSYHQTGEQRFGPRAKHAITAFLHENNIVAMTETGESEDDSDSPGDSDDGTLPASPGPTTGYVVSDALSSQVPRMQRARNGCTALSQRFNLYFTAYQDKIYVYRPQRPPQILPDESLILRPARSAIGKKVGGYQNQAFGHQVNQLIVGELGELEVLLFCYDDGDVVAYYTHHIADYIISHSRSQEVAFPKQFFHANVGKSAWGLAVHKKSRLFAVTCNKHEVTVFAFSITDYDHGYNPAQPDKGGAHSGWARAVPAVELEKHLRSRTRSWQIILPVGIRGQNMPNVAFCNDADGNAEKVVAVDIGGSIWIVDIWKIGSSPVAYPEPKRQPGICPVSWGVLVLSDEDFRPVNGYCEAFGVPKKQIIASERQPGKDGFPWWDITCSLFYLRDSGADQYRQLKDLYSYPYFESHIKALPVDMHHPDGDMPWVYPELDDNKRKKQKQPAQTRLTVAMVNESASSLASPRRTGSGYGNPGGGKQEPGPWPLFTEYERKMKVNFFRIISPGPGHLGGNDSSPDAVKKVLDSELSRCRDTTAQSYREAKTPPHHSKMSILCAGQDGIELYPLDFKSRPGIQCNNVVSYHMNHGLHIPLLPPPWDLDPEISERLSMLHHIRELNLVVCGSLCGRVALVTLTKTRRYHADMPFRYGFRVDAVLPRRSDEAAPNRPWAPLHGIAVSPVPDHKARGLDLHRPGGGVSTGMVYRLILHYLNHSIILYHLSRSNIDEELLIF